MVVLVFIYEVILLEFVFGVVLVIIVLLKNVIGVIR